MLQMVYVSWLVFNFSCMSSVNASRSFGPNLLWLQGIRAFVVASSDVLPIYKIANMSQ